MADSNPADNTNLPAPENGLPDTGNLIPHIEALIFASDKPLTNAEIVDLVNAAFGFTDAADQISTEQVDTALEGIVEKYSS